jgi:hypothetical protein
MTASANALADAWQDALRAEQRAVFGYALLGPRLTDPSRTKLARTCQGEHEALRRDTISGLVDAGQTPAAPEPDYPDLDAAAGDAVDLAVRLEQDAATAWRYLYATAAQTAGTRAAQLRGSAQAGLTASAIRATRWRLAAHAAQPTVPFPGI